MTREDHRDYLFSRALDQVDEGVQIYDKNACAVYFNKASRDISHIPSGIDPRGRHLLDLYNLDEGVSTTMTALRTQSPVINRVDHFEVSDGAHIATANTSYPILREGELLGAVVFEQTQELVQRNIKRLEETGQAMKEYASKASQISFSGYTFDHVIGHNPNLRAAVSVAKKEIFAQSIHRASPRRGKKFLAINCAAIPDTLIESLLFGTQKGSFIGSEDQSGYFEEAAGGTLFLDGLNSMRLAMQSKILRVIQENTFRRVGGNKDLALDVRIISSCNEDPFRSISENRFRRDLFYRPSTVMIELLPLREQLDDLEELISRLLNATSYQYVHRSTHVEQEVYDLLRAYHWPGNVRDLFHVLDYAQNVGDSGTLCLQQLPSYLLKDQPILAASPTPASIGFT